MDQHNSVSRVLVHESRMTCQFRFMNVLPITVLLLAMASASSLHGQMVYNVSVYNNGWVNNSTLVYGESTSVDNSYGCGHSGYTTTTNIYTPDGRYYSGAGNMTSNTSAPTNGITGMYRVTGAVNFYCACAGYLETSGYDTYVQVACTFPSGETSSYTGKSTQQTPPGPYPGVYAGAFDGSLLGSSNYSGRTVGEYIYFDTPDSCHFDGSAYPSFPTNQPSGTWSVRSTNTYGEDWIGLSTGAADYYQQQIINHIVSYSSCGFSNRQAMYIDACGAPVAYYDQGHPLSFTITAGSMSSARGQASGAAK